MLIADLERRSRLTRDTIRFYERAGLIGAPHRRPNGYREYDEDSVRELRFISAAREIGFTLEQIRTALPSLKAPPARCAALLAQLDQRRTQIRLAIAAERKRLRRVDDLIERFSAVRWDSSSAAIE